MSKFFIRNKPIFTIAALITLVFAGIIILYKLKSPTETSMSKVRDETLYKVIEEEQRSYEEDLTNGNTTQDQNQEEQNQEGQNSANQEINVEEMYGIKEIEYTIDGFKPRITKAFLGQTARWTNKTDVSIYFHQRKQTYEELNKLIEIKPGESFSFKMSVTGLWTYDENGSKHFGSIEVLNTPIQSTQE